MQPGDVVAGRFELKSLPAAHGGTAAIFRAKDLQSGAMVALKVSYGRKARDARRFEREAQYLDRFDHGAIVRYIAHGIADNGIAYLAVEWLAGEDLAQRLERVGLTIHETLTMVSQVAGALEHAHAHGVMHRDVNPENLFLVDRDPARLKVLDFGVAGDVDGRGTWDQMSGAPVYMSPEQLGGAVIDWRSDIFSLGCVFYECLTGRRPFGGETLMEIVNSVMASEPAPLTGLPPVIAQPLAALMSQMLAKEPLDRPKASRIVREVESMRRQIEPGQRAAATKASRYLADERRLVCVAVVQPPAEAVPVDKSTARMADATSNELALSTDVAARFGASVAFVPGMGLLVVPDSRFLVTDQIALVARCALALSAAMPEVGIGIAARREVVKGDGWPFGEAVTVASDLANAAGVDILVDPSVRELLGTRFKLVATERGTMLRSYDPGAEVTTFGREVRLIGRERELSYLEERIERVRRERRALASCLLAPAGAGKSRLIREALRRVGSAGHNLVVLAGRGDPIGSGSPFAVAAQVVRSALDLGSSDPAATQYAALEARVDDLHVREHGSKLVAYLGALLGLPPGRFAADLAWAVRDAAMMADGIRWAFGEWLRLETARTDVLMVVLEDLHWGDVPSARIVAQALDAAANTPLCVVALARADVEKPYAELLALAESMELAPLSEAEATELARALLGTRANEDLLQRLVTQSGGNPLFMRELAALPDDADARLPETVLSTAQANLERLDAPARRILRAASVFGEVFWPSGIVTLLGHWHADEVAEWLPWLSSQGLLEERPLAQVDGERGYAFHAQLLRDAAYAMLSDADRVSCHRLAAEWLEQHRDVDALALAEQWMRGGVPARAVAHFERAAAKALEGNDFEGVITYAERAIRCDPRGELLGTLHLQIARAHEWATDNEACAASAQLALANLKRGTGVWFEAFQHAFAASVRMFGAAGVDHLCRELEDLEGAMIAHEEEVVALARASGFLMMYGDLDRGRTFFRRAEHRAQQFPDRQSVMDGWLAWARGWQAQAAGELAESLEHDIASMYAFQTAGDLRNLCYARSNVGYAYMRLGLAEDAEQHLADALDTANRLGLRTIASGAAHNLGLVQGLLGKHDLALETEQWAIKLFSSLKSGRGETMATEYLARIHLMRGDVKAAELAARRARELAGDWQSLVAICCASLARALMARGDHAAGLREAERAMELFEMLGSADGEEHYITAAYAEALVKLGRSAEAVAALDDACEALTAAASRIASQRTRDAFLQRVPEHHRLLALRRALSR